MSKAKVQADLEEHLARWISSRADKDETPFDGSFDAYWPDDLHKLMASACVLVIESIASGSQVAEEFCND